MTQEFFPFNTGVVLVMEYNFLTNKLWERDYEFHVSRNGRLTFKRDPALFQGMKQARLGQYTLYRGYNARGVYQHEAQMVVSMFDNEDFEHQRYKFVRQVLKHVNKNTQERRITRGAARMFGAD